MEELGVSLEELVEAQVGAPLGEPEEALLWELEVETGAPLEELVEGAPLEELVEAPMGELEVETGAYTGSSKGASTSSV